MRHIVSFSGGKNPTAMLHWLLEKGYPVDAVVFFDTGWEFPAMLKHIDLVEKNIGMKITRLKPKKSFEYLMLQTPVVARKGPMKGKVHRIGYGWPSHVRRWCTREKMNTISSYIKPHLPDEMYIGITSDEKHKIKESSFRWSNNYPLVQWGKTEADCLKYCQEIGYQWNGLYNIFARVSCFCCPLQSTDSLRKLRTYFPDLWTQMLHWDRPEFIGFKGYKSVHDLDFKFAQEDTGI